MEEVKIKITRRKRRLLKRKLEKMPRHTNELASTNTHIHTRPDKERWREIKFRKYVHKRNNKTMSLGVKINNNNINKLYINKKNTEKTTTTKQKYNNNDKLSNRAQREFKTLAPRRRWQVRSSMESKSPCGGEKTRVQIDIDNDRREAENNKCVHYG